MQLRDYLKFYNIKPKDFAVRIRVKPASVYRYRSGVRFPDPDEMERIVEATHGSVTSIDFHELRKQRKSIKRN